MIVQTVSDVSVNWHLCSKARLCKRDACGPYHEVVDEQLLASAEALSCNLSPPCTRVEDERSSLYINIRETKTVMYRCAQLLSHCKILLQAAV
eukprot:14451-Heterococcus_DN1.PRE.2